MTTPATAPVSSRWQGALVEAGGIDRAAHGGPYRCLGEIESAKASPSFVMASMRLVDRHELGEVVDLLE